LLKLGHLVKSVKLRLGDSVVFSVTIPRLLLGSAEVSSQSDALLPAALWTQPSTSLRYSSIDPRDRFRGCTTVNRFQAVVS